MSEDLADEDRFYNLLKGARLFGRWQDAQDDDPGKEQLGRFICYLPEGPKTLATLTVDDLRAMEGYLVWYRQLRITLQEMERDLLGGEAA